MERGMEERGARFDRTTVMVVRFEAGRGSKVVSLKRTVFYVYMCLCKYCNAGVGGRGESV